MPLNLFANQEEQDQYLASINFSQVPSLMIQSQSNNSVILNGSQVGRSPIGVSPANMRRPIGGINPFTNQDIQIQQNNNDLLDPL